MDKVKFELHTPQVVTLKTTGKIVPGQFGEQTFYVLQDGRAMYLDLAVSQKLNFMEVRPGESVSICKRGKGVWDIELSPATERMRTARFGRQIPPDANESEVGRQVRQTLENIAEGRSPAAPRPQAVPARYPEASALTPAPGATAVTSSHSYSTGNSSKLEDALKSVVSAVHGAAEYAKTIGYAMPQFTSEDLRTMANTLIIDAQRNGGSRAA
jgi:antitoxin (DNA-binding transcriptional repressor) of toxin-antitoxin stability system